MICQKCWIKEAVKDGYRCEECLKKIKKLCVALTDLSKQNAG